jgi:hypothetical protein
MDTTRERAYRALVDEQDKRLEAISEAAGILLDQLKSLHLDGLICDALVEDVGLVVNALDAWRVSYLMRTILDATKEGE